MKRLGHAHELLDGPLEDPAALRGNLRDLRRINELLGGTELSVRAIRTLLGDRPAATVLDVGTGGADIPAALIAASGAWRGELSVVAVDSRAEVLDAARSLEPGLDSTAGLTLRRGDGRRLDWPDGTFDVAHASLVVHHLEPADAVAFLAELARVSRAGVVVNDLARGWRWWAAAWLGTRLLTRNRLTRHDAPLSVRRAYTPPELVGLLAAARLRPVALVPGPFGHRFALAAVPLASRSVGLRSFAIPAQP